MNQPAKQQTLHKILKLNSPDPPPKLAEDKIRENNEHLEITNTPPQNLLNPFFFEKWGNGVK